MAAVEREGRSVALETAYVHDVYDQISTHCPSCSAEGAEGSNGARVWPRVRQFIQDLEPGSLVCDVGKIYYIPLRFIDTATLDLFSRLPLPTWRRQ